MQKREEVARGSDYYSKYSALIKQSKSKLVIYES